MLFVAARHDKTDFHGIIFFEGSAILSSKKWACVSRMGSTGDNLIASSVLPLLKRQGYMVEVICQPPHHVVFENNPYIDKLTVKHKDDLPNNGVDWQRYFVSRAKEYDKFFHLSHSIESNLALHPDSTWFNWPDGPRRAKCGKSYLAETHDICELPHEFAPAFYPTDEEIADARRTKAKMGERVIAWVIAGSRIDKLYPYSSMAVGRLIKETGLPVVMMGTGRDARASSSAEAIMKHVELQNGGLKGLHATTGYDTWPMRRSLTLVQACDLVISPDTGLAWAVASCWMPKIMLLGHASPTNITHGWVNTTTLHANPVTVPCWPCHKLHNDPSTCVANKENNGAACISDISVEQIVAAAKSALLIQTSSEDLPATDVVAGNGADPDKAIMQNWDLVWSRPRAEAL